ncbi:hypothetical protein [Acidovorax sp. Leaf78]|uniref:hypothetical protein n=1 Tax=unclassified Acidovorax TaxID=2684926 RepID=UPI000A98E33A|nr:hypothetical protein [Acidovorax sp. Leaf78]
MAMSTARAVTRHLSFAIRAPLRIETPLGKISLKEIIGTLKNKDFVYQQADILRAKRSQK